MTAHRILRRPLRRIAASGGLTAVLVTAGFGVAAAPAAADPVPTPLDPGVSAGGAGGGEYSFDLTVDGTTYAYSGLTVLGETVSTGERLAEGTSGSLASLPAGEDWLSVSTGAYLSTALADAWSAPGAAWVEDSAMTLFGMPIASFDRIGSSSTCPTGGVTAGGVEASGIEVLGQAVDTALLNPGDPWASGRVPIAAPGGLGDLEVEVEIERNSLLDDDSVYTWGLIVRTYLSGPTDDGVLDDELVATLVLGVSGCTRPPVQPIAVASLSASSGPTTGAQLLTITGTGFSGNTRLLVDDVQLAPESVTPTSVAFYTPAHAAGPATIVLDSPGASVELPFTYVDPSVASVRPASGHLAGGNTVTITGAGLSTVSAVRFGDALATAVTVSADGKTVTAVAPAGRGTVALRLELSTGQVLSVPGGYGYVAAGGGAKLAATGSGESGLWIAGGGALLLAGAGAILFARSRARRV